MAKLNLIQSLLLNPTIGYLERIQQNLEESKQVKTLLNVFNSGIKIDVNQAQKAALNVTISHLKRLKDSKNAKKAG